MFFFPQRGRLDDLFFSAVSIVMIVDLIGTLDQYYSTIQSTCDLMRLACFVSSNSASLVSLYDSGPVLSITHHHVQHIYPGMFDTPNI